MKNTTELEALQNAANNINGKAEIHLKYNDDGRVKTNKYFLAINDCCVSPVLDYENLNHFILGFIKCQKLQTA